MAKQVKQLKARGETPHALFNFTSGEKLLRVVRKTWFFVILKAAALIALALLPLVAIGVLPVFAEQLSVSVGFSLMFSLFLYSMWLQILLLLFFFFWVGYYLDAWYITNKRIIDVNQITLFNREITSVHYERVQDVTVQINGLIAEFFNFGDLHVQTAGDDQEVVIVNANRPHTVKKVINENLEADTVEERGQGLQRGL